MGRRAQAVQGKLSQGWDQVSPARCVWCPWQSSRGEFRVFWAAKPWP